VAERDRLGDEGWKKLYRYNELWKCDPTFSTTDRVFGESIKARRRDLMFGEARPNSQTYDAASSQRWGGSN